MTKARLFLTGSLRVAQFCQRNGLVMPTIETTSADDWRLGTCAYYRPEPVGIQICIPRCAALGYVAQAWSWPGYVVDRTPFGVVCHEMGHAADVSMASNANAINGYWSDFSVKMRAEIQEDRITTYCPNDGEWFAEIFRLYLTNPALLNAMRPGAFRFLLRHWRFVEDRDWPDVLADAPERTRKAAQNKVDVAAKARARSSVLALAL